MTIGLGQLVSKQRY